MKRAVLKEEEVPLHEVTDAEVTRLDGVLGPANDMPFLLMRAKGEVDLLDEHLKRKVFERSKAASGTTKQRAASKHKLMVGGEAKYPINDCSDVSDAWGLRGQGKGVSQSAIESYIKSAAKDLGCPVPGGDVKREKKGEEGSAEEEATESASEAEAEGDVERFVQAAESLSSSGILRIGKRLSADTEGKIRTSLEALQSLLGDIGVTEIPEGVEVDKENLNKAGDDKDGKDVKLDVTRTADERAKSLGFKSVEDLIAAYERAQAPRVGVSNAPDLGGAPGTPSVDALAPGGANSSVGGESAHTPDPDPRIVDGTAAMAKAVGMTKANVQLATSEEESPDIGQVIARSVAGSFKEALEDALKPVKESLERISKEDSRGQGKPFMRGAEPPRGDYHLVQRNDGPAFTTESDELQRALSALDPSSRDLVTRELAKNAHPLNRQQ